MPYVTRWAVMAIVLGIAMILLSASLVEAGEQRTVNAGGVARTYYSRDAAQQPRPLVIMLHGAGERGGRCANTAGSARPSASFVVAGPDVAAFRTGRQPADQPRFWNDGSARGSLAIPQRRRRLPRRMVDDIARFAAIDRNHIMSPAISGAGRQRLAVEHAPIATPRWRRSQHRRHSADLPVRAMPFLYLSGDSDPLNPVQGGRVRLPWGNTFTKPGHGAITQRWRELDGCPPPTRTTPAPAVRLELASPCRGGVEVRYVLVEGMGHRWAGGGRDILPDSIVGPASNAINVTDTVWDFLRRWRLR